MQKPSEYRVRLCKNRFQQRHPRRTTAVTPCASERIASRLTRHRFLLQPISETTPPSADPDTEHRISHSSCAIIFHDLDGKLDVDTTSENETYDRAIQVFLHRHLCRANPWPADLQATLKARNLEVGRAMRGPYQTRATGRYGSYDGSSKLGQINVPTLLTYGEFDLVLSGSMCGYQHMIAGSRLYRTKDGSHMPWFEFAEDYNSAVAAFLAPIG